MNINKDTPNSTIIKSLERKIVIVLLALFFVMMMPNISKQYLAFNMIYNTMISDVFFFFGGTPLADISIIYFLAIIILIYVLQISVSLFRYKRQDEISESLFNAYRRFDVVTFVVILLAAYIFMNAFLFSISSVEGRSMEPTLYENDHVIIKHVRGDYERFDMVVIRRDNTEQYMVKRLIGLPGETVTIDNGQVYINDTLLDESAYISEDTQTECEFGVTYCTFPLDGVYFFLGDNRKHSYDSRHFGTITENQLYGTVNYRIRPFHAIGRID